MSRVVWLRCFVNVVVLRKLITTHSFSLGLICLWLVNCGRWYWYYTGMLLKDESAFCIFSIVYIGSERFHASCRRSNVHWCSSTEEERRVSAYWIEAQIENFDVLCVLKYGTLSVVNVCTWCFWFLFDSVVEFATHGDMKNALIKLNGQDLNGRKIRLIDDSKSRSSKKRRLVDQ